MNGRGRLLLLLWGMLAACAHEDTTLGPLELAPSSSVEGLPVLELWAADPGDPAQLTLRWKGDIDGPAADSPEQSALPTLGFGRPYAFQWTVQASEGFTLGAMVRASQVDPDAVLPAGVSVGETATFLMSNEVPPLLIPPMGCDGGPDCPEQRRWDSGRYEFALLALDALGRARELTESTFDFDANYPPESSVVVDEQYPRYRAPDGQGGFMENSFAAGDTIPANAYALFRRDGYDRFAGSVDDPDSFCCDERVDLLAPEVRFQTRLELEADEGFRIRRYETIYSAAEAGDTLGFAAGPFAYHVIVRTVDEHDRRDESPDTFDFVAGFLPRIVALSPSGDASMVLRNPLDGTPWPENEVPYDVPVTTVTRYWDGLQFQLADAPGRIAVSGHLFGVPLRFDGAVDPREPANTVRAWTYRLVGEFDPGNLVLAPDESDDLSFFVAGEQTNVLERVVEIFVPALMWSLPELFEPGSVDPDFAAMGEHLRAWLGAHDLQAQARTTQAGDTFTIYAGVRPPDLAIPVNIELAGRRSTVAEATFGIHLGLDPSNTGSIERLWPDEPDAEVRP